MSHRAAPLRLAGNAFDAAALEQLIHRAETAITALDQAVDAQVVGQDRVDDLRDNKANILRIWLG